MSKGLFEFAKEYEEAYLAELRAKRTALEADHAWDSAIAHKRAVYALAQKAFAVGPSGKDHVVFERAYERAEERFKKENR